MIDTKKRKIIDLHKELQNKDISAVELTKEYLKNIEKQEKDLNAFVTITGDLAIKQAEAVDKKIASKEEISLIAGIACGLKDNFNLINFKTTASSKILDNYISPYNATVTQRLLDNDVVFVGKTNMDAFAHGSSTETSDYGVSKNPYDKSRIPGGSSGGSAVSVASDMSAYAIE